jgi:hypothetical protein
LPLAILASFHFAIFPSLRYVIFGYADIAISTNINQYRAKRKYHEANIGAA